MSTIHHLDMKKLEVIQAAVEVKLAQEECVRARRDKNSRRHLFNTKGEDMGKALDIARSHLLTTLLFYYQIAEEVRIMSIKISD